MKALVIAAGEGKRFRAGGFKGPKPLYPLLGLSLIERTIFGLREAGVDEIVLVLGYQQDEIRQYLEERGDLGVKIQVVVHPGWSAGNGTSVLAAQQFLREEPSFLLTMADHIVSQDVFKQLTANLPGPGEVLVGADFNLACRPDLREATKITVADNNRVVDIGKEIKEFSAVDCGVFHATPALFAALAEAQARGRYTLSDGIRVLAGRGRAFACSIGDAWWIDVDQPEDAKRARKLLLGQLPSPRDGLVARYLNRKLSVPLTGRLAQTGCTPNHVSLFTAFLCALSAVSFVFGSFLWGGLLAQIASILDGVDGELARLKYLRSHFGELFDSILDRYSDGVVLIGMAVGTYLQNSSPWVLVLGAAALLGAPMSMLMKEKFRSATGRTYLPAEEGPWVNLLLGNRDGRLFVVMLSGVLHVPLVGLTILALTSHLLVLVRFNLMRRQM